MKKYNLVIARYNENLDWLKDLDVANIDITVYNKGKDNIDFPFIQLPNIGGDAHTYIYHMTNDYNNLYDYTIFIQAYPFDHCIEFIAKMYNHKNQYFQFFENDVELLAETIHCGWEQDIMKQRPEAAKHPITYMENTAQEILGKEDVPEYFLFAPGQQFIVSRDTVYRRKVEFYQNILNMFEYNYLLPWFLERLWLDIFKIKL